MEHLRVFDVLPRRGYIAFAGQVAFTVPFAFVVPGDLLVYVNGALATDGYSVTGAAVDGGFSSGTVTFARPQTAGTTVAILRSIALARVADFPYPSQILDIRALNNDLDRLVMMVQQVWEASQRGLIAPPGEASLGTMPSRAARAGKILGFDGNGNPIATTTILDFDVALDQAVTAAANALVASNQALAAASYIAIAAGSTDEAVAAAATVQAMVARFGAALTSPPTITADEMFGVSGPVDLGDLAATSPFLLENLPDVRVDLARDASGTIDLGDLT